MLRYVENPSPDWAPLPVPDGTPEPHPDWAIMFDGADFDRSDPPPALTDLLNHAGVFPTEHMLRPHTRIYWVDGDIPEAPEPGSLRWNAVDALLKGDPRTRPAIPAVDGFTSEVFTDADDIDSLGNWSRKYVSELYPWSGPHHHKVPPYLKVGQVPWANGSDNNAHYDLPLWVLEEFRRTGDPECWKLFTKLVLHQAGLGINWSTGNWRYEKARWIWTGDFYPEGYVKWSHAFPSGLLLYWHLTGELQEAASMVINHTITSAQQNRADYNGNYGPRRTAWYLRFLQTIELVTAEYNIPLVAEEATLAMESVFPFLRPAAGGGQFLQELQGQPPGHNGEISVPYTAGMWANWLFAKEALWWAVYTNNESAIQNLRHMVDWMSQGVNAEGRVAYTATVAPDGTLSNQFYRGATHTAVALGAMYALTAMGHYPAAEFVKSRDLVVAALPHGILGNETTIPGDRDRALGGAAPKICGDLAFGLRSWYFTTV